MFRENTTTGADGRRDCRRNPVSTTGRNRRWYRALLLAAVGVSVTGCSGGSGGQFGLGGSTAGNATTRRTRHGRRDGHRCAGGTIGWSAGLCEHLLDARRQRGCRGFKWPGRDQGRDRLRISRSRSWAGLVRVRAEQQSCCGRHIRRSPSLQSRRPSHTVGLPGPGCRPAGSATTDVRSSSRWRSCR